MENNNKLQFCPKCGLFISRPRRRSGDYQRREYTDEQQRHPDDSVFSTFESEHLEEAPTTSLYGKIEINKD